jgi:lipopolysaccharide export LptBFGC system permease protein LptF
MYSKRIRLLKVAGLVAAVLCLAAAVCAQSLGETARQERAKKGAAAPAKASRVFTNENLPREGGLSTSDTGAAPKDKTEGQAKEGAAKEGEAKAEGKEGEKKTEGAAAKPTAEAEKEYREKAAKLREALATEERKLDVLQRESNLAGIQYYSDPNRAMNEQYSRNELNTRQAEIDKQKATIEAARRAISNLEDELRKKNLPPGWAR